VKFLLLLKNPKIMSNKKQNYMSLKDASKYMGNMHPVYLRELARANGIPAVKFSDSPKAQWYFLAKDLDKWAKKNGEMARLNLANKKSK